jgi:hypothetical protein
VGGLLISVSNSKPFSPHTEGAVRMKIWLQKGNDYKERELQRRLTIVVTHHVHNEIYLAIYYF